MIRRTRRRSGGSPCIGALAAPLALMVGIASCAAQQPPVDPPPSLRVFVSPRGDDAAAGTASAPLRTIAAALARAVPGVVVDLAPGTYRGRVDVAVSGTAAAPITIEGHGTAVLTGGPTVSTLLEIGGSYIVVDGVVLSDAEVLVRIDRGDRNTLRNSRVGPARDECIRLKRGARQNVIERNLIRDCGTLDFVTQPGLGKNGEAVYIGTAPEQREPLGAADASDSNMVRDNIIHTNGNECVDVKEGSSRNVVEHNRCSGQRDPLSGGVSLRGNGNTVRFNDIFGNLGAGVRLGGDRPVDGRQNQVYGNRIADNSGYGLKIETEPQAAVCRNTLERNKLGPVNEPEIPTDDCPRWVWDGTPVRVGPR